MARGFPTPDMPNGDITYGCIPVFVPNNPEFQAAFASAIYGLYAEMSKEYFWRETGTMSVEQAALLASYGLAQTEAYDVCGEGAGMSCLDVANCIETDESVQGAITETITNDGFTPNPDTDMDTTPPPSLSTVKKSMNLLPASLDCELQPQIAMGLARAIVSELHQSAEDFFELIEYATNAAEGLAMATEQVPIFGKAISGALEFMDWVLETMAETYLAAYNQSVEDELACMIFCHIMDGCTLSIDDLISLYENKGSITVPPANDLQAILTFAIETPFSPDTVCVAVFHYQVLRFMSWGSLGGFSATYLQSLLNNNVSASDYSYEDLCDECATETPTDYWRLYIDLRISNVGTDPLVSVYDAGYVPDPNVVNTVTDATFKITDLGNQFYIAAVALRQVRRGSIGSGSNDYISWNVYGGANLTGAVSSYNSTSGININTNDLENGRINDLSSWATRSIAVSSRVARSTASKLGYLRTYELVIWGKPITPDTKPPRAQWVGDTLPLTIPELFPDYVAP
jgi:hypothetical protein